MDARPEGTESPLVLCYHALSRDWPADLAISPERFREHLEHLLRRGYRGATFTAVVEGAAPAKALAVTFDDGYRSVFEHARPILSELGIPGTIFVATDFVGSPQPMSWPGIDRWLGTPYEPQMVPMTWQQLRQLSKEGWEVGSHTRTHPHLPALDDGELEAELTGSRQSVEAEIGSCTSIAYPYGDQDHRVRKAARDARYEAACTMRPGPADPLRWPRVGVFPTDVPWRFRLKTSPLVRSARASRLGQRLERSRQERSARAA